MRKAIVRCGELRCLTEPNIILTSAKDRIVTVAILNLAVHRPEVIGPNYSFVLNTVINTGMPKGFQSSYICAGYF